VLDLIPTSLTPFLSLVVEDEITEVRSDLSASALIDRTAVGDEDQELGLRLRLL